MSEQYQNRYLDSARKRGLDILGGLTGTVLLLVSLPVVTLLVKLSSPGPIFYTQKRVGKNGKTFRMTKFRTMYRGSDRTKEMLRTQGASDPRITPVGRFLRRTHLDELPQFLSILRGDMSLVGPRPELPELLPDILEHEPRFSERHLTRPGVTGLAQIEYIHASDSQSAARRFKYDAEYLQTGSLMLDIRLILQTVLAVARSKGDR